MTAHARLEALWDALEAQGAVVQRLPLHTITARTANRMAFTAEKRLAILDEHTAPGPPDQPRGKAAIERLVRLVARGIE